MPDSFFQSDKKRKRPSRSGQSSSAGPSRSTGGGGYEKPYRPSAYGKGQKVQGQARHAAKRKGQRDEELSSDAGGEDGEDLDDMDFRGDRGREDERDDEDVIDENETAAEKRVRLARGYLRKVQDEIEAAKDDQDYDAAEIDRELIAARLQKDVSETEGRIHTFLAPHTLTYSTRFLKLPSQTPTSLALTPKSIYVSTKRGLIFPFSLPELRQSGKAFGQGKVPGNGKIPEGGLAGHKGEILAIAASEDGRFVVSGGRDRLVGVWEATEEGVKWVAGMKGHKDAITSIAFPPLSNPSHHILTASLSRHLTLHSLSTLSAIDTFFGHQDSISSVSSLKPTLAVTAGSRDRTCRWWKVEEEIQLVFRGGGRSFMGQEAKGEAKKGEAVEGEEIESEVGKKQGEKGKTRGKEFVEGSLDTVCMLDDQRFVSGGDSGSLCLWQTAKKKPIYTQPLAHGVDNLLHEDGQEMPAPRWITAIGALRGTDLFATGSWDGHIRLWVLDPSLRQFRLLQTIEIGGFINSIQILAVPASSINSSTWNKPSSAPDQELSDTPLEAESDEAGDTAAVRKSGKEDKDKREILLVAAIAQEPRLGRWITKKEGAKNGVFVVHLKVDGVKL